MLCSKCTRAIGIDGSSIGPNEVIRSRIALAASVAPECIALKSRSLLGTF